MAGDPEFAVSPVLWWRVPVAEGADPDEPEAYADAVDHEVVPQRLDGLIEAGGLRADWAYRWALVRCVDDEIWARNVGLTRDPACCSALVRALTEHVPARFDALTPLRNHIGTDGDDSPARRPGHASAGGAVRSWRMLVVLQSTLLLIAPLILLWATARLVLRGRRLYATGGGLRALITPGNSAWLSALLLSGAVVVFGYAHLMYAPGISPDKLCYARTGMRVFPDSHDPFPISTVCAGQEIVPSWFNPLILLLVLAGIAVAGGVPYALWRGLGVARGRSARGRSGQGLSGRPSTAGGVAGASGSGRDGSHRLDLDQEIGTEQPRHLDQ